MREKIILATGNINKVLEIKEILKDIGFDIISKSELNNEKLNKLEVIEDKETLEGNAIKKAKSIWNITKGVVVADDTGLIVESLNGEPGVLSARYAGENSNDSKNREKLLKKLKNESNRAAKFVTVIAIINSEGQETVVVGECMGNITADERGENGFGYDSIFVPDGYDKTFAELPSDIKNKISHRYNALKNLEKYFKSNMV